MKKCLRESISGKSPTNHVPPAGTHGSLGGFSRVGDYRGDYRTSRPASGPALFPAAVTPPPGTFPAALAAASCPKRGRAGGIARDYAAKPGVLKHTRQRAGGLERSLDHVSALRRELWESGLPSEGRALWLFIVLPSVTLLFRTPSPSLLPSSPEEAWHLQSSEGRNKNLHKTLHSHSQPSLK